MATAQPLSKIMTDDLAALRSRIGSVSTPSVADLSPSSWVRENVGDVSIKKPVLAILIAVFAIGMLLGWLVIGWWLWPVEWTSYHPEQSSGDYQKMLINWAADRYWQTGDAAPVQQAFADYPRQDLAKLLLTMQRGTTDAETRRHLIALTEALHLPVTESSLLTFIFSQPLMLLSIFLSLAPLLVAFSFVTFPKLSMRIRGGVPAEMLADGTLPPAQESLDDLLVEVETGEQAVSGEGQEKTEEEKKEEEQSEQEADGQSAGLGDLASLFEEEDTSINVLEAFCKGMPDVSLDELLTMGADIAYRLRQGNTAR